MLAFWLPSDAAGTTKSIALIVVAGLLTVTAVEDMLEEAHASREDTSRSVLAFIAGFALFTLMSEGLGALIGEI